MRISTASIVLAGLLGASRLATAQDAPPTAPSDMGAVLARDGSFSFSDGSSVYTFMADHHFTLSPVNMSGRQIDGVWSLDSSGLVLVSGRWTWLNGASRTDDFREMLLSVTYIGGAATPANEHGGPPVYPVYFTIEHLAPITAEVYEERVAATAPSPAE